MHYEMFGILPVNAFLNMKLANPTDKRTFREFKVSVCRWSQIHAQDLGLRERRIGAETEDNIKLSAVGVKILRQVANRYKCKVRDKRDPRL